MACVTIRGSAVLKPFVKRISRALKSRVTLSAVIVCVPCAQARDGKIPGPGWCSQFAVDVVHRLAAQREIGQRHAPARGDAVVIVQTSAHIQLQRQRFAESEMIQTPHGIAGRQKRPDGFRVKLAADVPAINLGAVVLAAAEGEPGFRLYDREIGQMPDEIRVGKMRVRPVNLRAEDGGIFQGQFPVQLDGRLHFGAPVRLVIGPGGQDQRAVGLDRGRLGPRKIRPAVRASFPSAGRQ